MDTNKIKELLDKANEDLKVLAEYLELNKIDYKPTLKNIEYCVDIDEMIHRELKVELEIIERIQ